MRAIALVGLLAALSAACVTPPPDRARHGPASSTGSASATAPSSTSPARVAAPATAAPATTAPATTASAITAPETTAPAITGGAPRRPVATYSIVARDPATGQLGVAVQSHWFSVGAVVPWAEPDVGAVASQSFADPRYGTLGLQLLRGGRSAEQALAALVSTDAGEAQRQVGIVDAQGRVAAHTGARCIAEAGHLTGEQYTVQANLMHRPGVPQAMAAAFEAATGDLAARLLAALAAAEAAGGDVRGRQSAALLVVRAEGTGEPWRDRLFDLRVEDHPDPVPELLRLVAVARVYHALDDGDRALAAGDLPAALAAYARGSELLPDEATNGEAAFWAGVTLAGEGRLDEALPFLRRAGACDARWALVLQRLPAAGLLPDDAGLQERLQAAVAGE